MHPDIQKKGLPSMKVLNVSSTLDPVTGGGEAERSYQMSKFLHEAGVDCQLMTLDIGLTQERKAFIGEGRVIALPCLFRRFYVPRVSLSKINAIVKEVDLVHLIGHWTILNVLVFLSIRKNKKPYVMCPAGALRIFGRSVWFKRFYNIGIGRKILQNASMCIAITADETSSFESYGVDKNKIRVVPNGISESDFLANDEDQFRRKYKLENRPFILFVGRLNLIKGPDLLLKAFCQLSSRFADVDLIFAGPDGGMLDELKQIALSAGIENRVHFPGYLVGDDKSQAYHAARFLAIPSRHEAMSIVVLESWVCGTPVLFTDQCGIDQIAELGGGWVVPASIDGLKVGLIDALSSSEITDVAADEIKKHAVSNYSWTVIADNLLKLYRGILSKSI